MSLKYKTIEDSKLTQVNTRFGEISIAPEKKIAFNDGLLGIPFRNFCLANFPQNEHFKILQSLENDELSFMVLPIYSGDEDITIHDLIEKEDILKAAKTFDIAQKDLLMMLIVTIHNDSEANASKLSVNLRAPLVIDVKNAIGFQHVFTNQKYIVRHFVA